MTLPIGLFSLLAVVFSFLGTGAQAQAFGPAITAWFTQTQNTISGLAVQTKQVAMSSQQKSGATHSSFKALADTIVTAELNLDAMDALRSATSTLTSGGGLCDNVNVGTAAVDAESVADIVRTGVSDFERNWRTTGGEQAAIYESQLEMRQDVFCSEAEFQRGLCTIPPSDPAGLDSAEFPASDTNAASFMLRRSYGSTTAMNGVNYIDSIAPLETYDASASTVSAELANILAVQNMTWNSVARGAVADVVGRGTEGN